MPKATHPAERALGTRLAVIRVTAALSMVYGLLYVFTALLLLTGALSEADEATRDAAFYLIASSAIPAILMLLMSIFGFRAARDRFRIMPFCVVSVIYSVLMLASMVLTGFVAVTQVLTQGFFGILSLAYNVLSVVAACMAIGIIGYNKRHPEGEKEIPAPEHVPDSLRAPAAPTPIDAPEPEAIDAASVSVLAAVPDSASTDVPLELRISSKIGSVIHDKMDVLDAHDNVIYRVHSAAISLHDRTQIDDAAGNKVADIHAKLISIHNRYYVEMADGVQFEMASELFHVKDVVNIDELGWQLRGDHMIEFNFDIEDQATGAKVAHASRQLVSLHDTYTVEVFDRARADEIVTIFVVMKHILEHREHAAASSSATSSAQ